MNRSERITKLITAAQAKRVAEFDSLYAKVSDERKPELAEAYRTLTAQAGLLTAGNEEAQIHAQAALLTIIASMIALEPELLMDIAMAASHLAESPAYKPMIAAIHAEDDLINAKPAAVGV